MYNEVKLLERIKNIIIDVEVLEDEITFNRVRRFLDVANKLIPQRIRVFVPENYSEEPISLIHRLGLTQNSVINRPRNLYRRYRLIHKIFGKTNPNWIECRQTLYLNYFESNRPIHAPNEFNVYPSANFLPNDKGVVPIICPLRKLYTCNIVRNCINNCIYCYVPSTGAPMLPLVVCVNMPEKIREQVKRMKKPYIITNFGSITDPCNPLIDNVFRVFRESFSVLKEYNYPALILTKSNPSREILEELRYDNALLAFSFYHIDPNIKKEWELNAPSPSEVLRSVKEAKTLGVRSAFRIDIFPGYNDDLDLLEKIVKLAAHCGIEHITGGSLRARFAILQRIKALNPSAYKVILSSLDKRKYSNHSMRPAKEIRTAWYSRLSQICRETKIPFGLCKEEAELLEKFSTSPCLCQWVTKKEEA
jgi:DNA repair photolyase